MNKPSTITVRMLNFPKWVGGLIERAKKENIVMEMDYCQMEKHQKGANVDWVVKTLVLIDILNR